MTPRLWISLDYLRRWGGETRLNGVYQNDAIRDATAGFTVNLGLHESNAIQIEYRHDLETQSTNKTRGWSLRFQQMW